MRPLFMVAAALGLVALTPTAQANGRFPQAQQLVVHPTDPQRIVLRATFGIVLSDDGGQTWRVACERAVGYGGTEDPAIGITSSGRLLAGIFAGLATTPDFGCSWSFAHGDRDSGLSERFVVDVSVRKDDPSVAVAMVSMGMGGGAFLNQNYESNDAGETWVQLGTDIDPTFLGLTIDYAPSDATRMYMSGLVDVKDGVLLRSRDGGKAWETLPIPGTGVKNTPFIAAVHPTNPDILYVRTSANDAGDGGNFANDALLYSDDAGDTWTETLRAPAKLLGFALSPDGGEVLVGFGDPRDGTKVDASVLGLRKSATDSFSFETIFPGAISCITWTADGLYVCAAQFVHGFEVGFAPAPSFTLADTDWVMGKVPVGGKSALEPRLVLSKVAGMVQCGAGSEGARCEQDWPDLCVLLGKCEYGSDGGALDGGGGGTGGTSSGSGGGPGSDGEGGCGCRFPGGGQGPWQALALSALALAAMAGRRARRTATRAAHS